MPQNDGSLAITLIQNGFTAAAAVAIDKAITDAGIGSDADARDLLYAEVPNDGYIKRPVLQATQVWETTIVQEPTVWYDTANQRWGMYYTGGPTAGIAYAFNAGNPYLDPWTKVNLAAPAVANTAHSFAYVDEAARLLYVYTPVNSNLALYRASMDSPQNLTFVANVMALPASAVAWGNPYVVREPNGTFTLFIELRETASNLWRIGIARSNSLTGPFTLGTFPLTSLFNGIKNGSTTQTGTFCGGAHVQRTASGYVMWYHGGVETLLVPTEVYKAVSTDGENWIVLNGGFPVLRRTTFFEDDQVADINFATGKQGTFAFWTGYNNSLFSPRAVVMCAPVVFTQQTSNAGNVQFYETGRYLGPATLANREWGTFEVTSATTVTLPVGALGMSARVSQTGTTNNGTTGTLTVTAQGTDRIIDPATGNEVASIALTTGQTRTFYCKRFIGGGSAHVCWTVI